MLLFPLFLLIIQQKFDIIFARSTNNSGGIRHSRRASIIPKVYDVEFVLRQAQNDDFDDILPPSKSSSVVYPSSAIIPEEDGDGIDPLDDEDDIDGEDKEIKRMPSRFYRRRFGNRYIRPFIGGNGGGGGGGMPGMNGGGGMPPFGYGMRRPGGMALGGMNMNGMGGGMNGMGGGMAGNNGGGMGSGMMMTAVAWVMALMGVALMEVMIMHIQ
uniref:Glycine-rich protein n=1 Tax=Panagrolaimus superbus TaxID=310955 RepID=A0A914YCN4_9BILA